MMCRLYLASLLLLSSVIGVPVQAASPDALWQIAHEQCLPNSIPMATRHPARW